MAVGQSYWQTSQITDVDLYLEPMSNQLLQKNVFRKTKEYQSYQGNQNKKLHNIYGKAVLI